MVTDNAANIIKMRKNLDENSKLILITPFDASLDQDSSALEIKVNVVEIAKYFHNNHCAAGALKKVGKTKVISPTSALTSALF